MKLSLQNNDTVDNEELFNSENHIMQINDILRLYQIELFRNITEFQLNFNLEKHLAMLEYIQYAIHLKNLEIYNNTMEMIDMSEWKFTDLLSLDMSRCELKQIPNFILNTKKIQKITLIENNITELRKSVLHLPHLRLLNLIDNCIIPCLLPPYQYNKYWLGLQHVNSDFNRSMKLIIYLDRKDKSIC